MDIAYWQQDKQNLTSISDTNWDIPQLEVKQIRPESRLIVFPATSIDPRVGISRSASETDVW